MTLIIDEQIILTKLFAQDSTELFKIVGKKLYDADFVTDRFVEEIIKREEAYPTGLPTKMPISLCHTDSEHIKKQFITLATLANPIPFHEMGNSENIHDVKIAFFLGIIDKKEHLAFLRKITNLVRSEEILNTIYQTESAKEIEEILIHNLI